MEIYTNFKVIFFKLVKNVRPRPKGLFEPIPVVYPDPMIIHDAVREISIEFGQCVKVLIA